MRGGRVARADVQLGASSLRASARARVDPNVTEKVDMAETVPDPGALYAIFVQATASDSAVISELVNTTGQIEVTATNAFTVHLTAMRSGTDDTLDEPGGVYSARATFELAFLALADGKLKQGCTLADRAGTVSESLAAKLRRRSDAKLRGACRATSKAAAKGKVSAECAGAVLGVLGVHCGG